MRRLRYQITAAHPRSTSPLNTNGKRSGRDLRHAAMIFPNPSTVRIAISKMSNPRSMRAELSSRTFPARNESALDQAAPGEQRPTLATPVEQPAVTETKPVQTAPVEQKATTVSPVEKPATTETQPVQIAPVEQKPTTATPVEVKSVEANSASRGKPAKLAQRKRRRQLTVEQHIHREFRNSERTIGFALPIIPLVILFHW